jgi:hypothetical protein
MGGAYSTYVEKKNAYTIFLETFEERSLGKSKSRWKDNIKTDLK